MAGNVGGQHQRIGRIAQVAAAWERAERAQVEQALADIAAVRGWLAAQQACALRRLEELRVQGTGPTFPEQTVADAGKVSVRAAARDVRRAEALGAFPAVQAALGAGEISLEHVEVVERAWRRLRGHARAALVAQGAVLAVRAGAVAPGDFEEWMAGRVRLLEDQADETARSAAQRRATALRWWNEKGSGMVRLSGAFAPELGAALAARVTAEMERRFVREVPEGCPEDPVAKADHLRALALLCVMGLGPEAGLASPGGVAGPGAAGADSTGGAAAAAGALVGARDVVDVGGGRGPLRSELIVVIDVGTLVEGYHEDSFIDAGGLELPLDVVRRMVCLSEIVPAVMRDGVVTQLGRGKRLASRDQRRALRAMYPRCVVPGCSVPFDRCRVHHLEWWALELGTTDLERLVPLCHHHHAAVHRGELQLRVHPLTRGLEARFADGTVMSTGPPRARAG